MMSHFCDATKQLVDALPYGMKQVLQEVQGMTPNERKAVLQFFGLPEPKVKLEECGSVITIPYSEVGVSTQDQGKYSFGMERTANDAKFHAEKGGVFYEFLPSSGGKRAFVDKQDERYFLYNNRDAYTFFRLVLNGGMVNDWNSKMSYWEWTVTLKPEETNLFTLKKYLLTDC